MKNIKKIYVDLDNTLWDSVAAIVELYESDYWLYKGFEKINPENINTWHFDELKCAKYKDILRYFNSPRFFEKIHIYDNALKTLAELSDDYDIVFVSMGEEPNLRGKELFLRIWIKFPYKFIGLNTKEHSGKGSVDMSDGIFIDDNSRFLNSSNAQIKICYGEVKQWNEDWNDYRCKDWNSCRELIRNLLDINGLR